VLGQKPAGLASCSSREVGWGGQHERKEERVVWARIMVSAPKMGKENLIQGCEFKSKRILNISKLWNWIQNRLKSNRVLETFEKWKSGFGFKIQI
jgi:hypothetical protein